MFSCEYYEIFKNTHFEKQLQMAAAVYSVSKLEKWEMENIKFYKSDDLIFGIFRSSTSEMLKKILALNIFPNSKKMYLVKFAFI